MTQQKNSKNRLSNIQVIRLGNWLEKLATGEQLPEGCTDTSVALHATEELGFQVSPSMLVNLRNADPIYDWRPKLPLSPLEALHSELEKTRALYQETQENEQLFAQGLIDLAAVCNLDMPERIHELAGDRDEHPQLSLANKGDRAA